MRARGAIRLVACALACLMRIGWPAAGQEQSSPEAPILTTDPQAPFTPTISAREGLLHIDLSISDRANNSISGLTASDLTLLDNGEQAKILSFHPSDPADANERLTEVAVVLDDINLPGLLFAQARSDLIKYLRQNDGHLSALISVYRLNSVGFYGSARPTTDGNQLAADLARNFFPRAIWSRPPGANLAAFAGNNDDWNKALRSVYALAVNWNEKPGRKVLVWIGPGWLGNGVIGSSNASYPFTLYVELLSRLRDARTVIYQVSPWVETRNRDFSYVLYASGARTASDVNGSTRHFSLPALALQSGGMVLDEGLSLAHDLDKCLHEAGSFYTISFDPPRAARVDEYRDLKVNVSKPGFTARTNTGYYNEPAFYDQPRIPAQRVSVQQLESTLSGDDKDDGVLADQLNALELTERLSSSKLANWLTKIRGKRSREALTALADGSVFLDPPDAELPSDPPPDPESRVLMLTRTAQYLNQILPSLPDFSALRTLVEFNQRVPEESSWKTALPDQSLYRWVTETSTLLYRNNREQQIIYKKKGNKSLTRDISFIGIFGPLLHRVFHDVLASGNGVVWSHWERGDHGNEAVFRYSTRSENPGYVIAYCCLRNKETFRAAPQYHGELAIDPQTGAILRITMQSEPEWIVEPDLAPVRPVTESATMVEYSQVQIGGNTYTCPQRSVATMRGRVVRPLIFWGQESRVWAPYETMIDDISFSDFHKFGSQSRILPGFTVEQEPPHP